MRLKVKKAVAIMMAWLMVFNMTPLQALAAEDSVPDTEEESIETVDEELSEAVSEAVESAVAETAEISMPAFEPDTVTIDGVAITVSAPEGVFPEGAALSVKKVAVWEQGRVEEAVEAERDTNVNVAVSYTFDITVLDADGNEIQPTDGSKVKVSFALAEVADENLNTNVYHVSENEQTGELEAEALNVTQEITEETGEATTATIETDGFSFYTVEFTYEQKQYVMNGDTTIPLADVLDYVGLVGVPTAVSVSNASLFSASNESGEWMVTAHQAFTSTEWMKITIDGVEYEIVVTDAQVHTTTSSIDYDLFSVHGGDILYINGSNTYNLGNCYANYYIDDDWKFGTTTTGSVASNGDITFGSYGPYSLKPGCNAWKVTASYGSGMGSPNTVLFVSITLSNSTYNVSGNTVTYDGNEHELITKSGDGGTIYFHYKLGSGDYSDWSTDIPSATDSGTYTVQWYSDANDSFLNKGSSGSPAGTVTATISIPAAVAPTLTGWSGTYNGSTHSVTATGASGGTVYYRTSENNSSWGSWSTTVPSRTNAGTTYVQAYTKGDSTHGDSGVTSSVSIAISRANINPSVSISGWTYGGTASDPTVTGNTGGGTATYKYKVSTAADGTYTTTKPSTAGTYTVQASIAQTTNYNEKTVTANFTISPKAVTITAKAQTITYGGAIATGTSQVTVSGLVSGETLNSITLTPSTSNATTSGTITPSAAVIKKDTTNVTVNYSITYTAGNLTINKASISPVVSITGWTYGAAAHAPSIPSGNPGSGTVTYRYTGTTYGAVDYDSATVPTQAGNYTVTATVAETDNYLGNTATADFTIARASITPSVTITGWTYGDTADAPVVTGNTGNGEESIRYTSRTGTAAYESSYAPTHAGDYTVTVTIAQTDNYLGNTASADFTIARQDINPLFDPDHPSNSNVEFSPTTVPNGVTPTVTLLDAQGNTIPTTEYKVATNGVDHEVIIQDKLDGTGTAGYGNYNIAMTTIAYPYEPGTATVTTVPRAATLTYNGADQSLLATAGAAANGSMAYAIGTDDTTEPSASDYVTDYDALTGKDAGDYYVWYKAVGDGENYQDSTPVCLRVTISKAVLTVTANEKDITYGDAPANAGVTYGGFQGDETATVLSGTLSFAYTYSQGGDVNAVGSATYNDFAIIPSGYTSNNYNINYVNGTLRVNKKPVDITITTADKVYDGTTSAAANATFTAADTVYTGDDLRIQNGTAEFSDANLGTGKTVTFSGFALAGDSVGNYLLNERPNPPAMLGRIE